MADDLGARLAQVLHWVSPLVLVWLAFCFGRTLRPGAMPLIERIGRRAIAAPSVRLCRYTRRLTALWCAYFVVAAGFSVLTLGIGRYGYVGLGAVIWCGTLLLFIGEWVLRKALFPGVAFPGLLQQVRDTWTVWRAHDLEAVPGLKNVRKRDRPAS